MLGKSQRKRTLAKPAPRKSLAGGGGRILTTHVGSLIRPVELQELLKARRDSQAYDKAASRRISASTSSTMVNRQDHQLVAVRAPTHERL